MTTTVAFSNPPATPIDPVRQIGPGLPSGLLSAPASGFSISLDASAPMNAGMAAWALCSAPFATLVAMGLMTPDGIYDNRMFRPEVNAPDMITAWIKILEVVLGIGGAPATVPAIDSRLTPVPIALVATESEQIITPPVHTILSVSARAAGNTVFVPDAPPLPVIEQTFRTLGNSILWAVTGTYGAGSYLYRASW